MRKSVNTILNTIALTTFVALLGLGSNYVIAGNCRIEWELSSASKSCALRYISENVEFCDIIARCKDSGGGVWNNFGWVRLSVIRDLINREGKLVLPYTLNKSNDLSITSQLNLK